MAISESAPETDLGTILQESPLHKAWINRIAEGRDIRVIISADNSATGVGKTTLAVFLALLWDIHGWGAEKATLDPREFSVLYDEVAPGSVLLLDEAEQAVDRRRSMSKDTLAIGHDFATKRYRQIPGILTLPSKDMMDARIADKLCDFWILVQDTGEAQVFKFDENPFTGKVYYKKVERLEWPALDDNTVFRDVEEKKHKRMTGQTQSRYVHRDEVEELKENYWNKATAQKTYEFVNATYDAAQDPDSNVNLSQTELGSIVGLSQGAVSKMWNSDSFTDYYKSHA